MYTLGLLGQAADDATLLGLMCCSPEPMIRGVHACGTGVPSSHRAFLLAGLLMMGHCPNPHLGPSPVFEDP